MPFFELLHIDNHSKARRGRIITDHGSIETPAFMPVGTQGTVKTLDQADLLALGAEIILGNTYHLHLRPGEELIAKQGGLHKFIGWNKPILTDSGGFQVFSLGNQKDKLSAVTPSPVSPLKRGEEIVPPLFKEGVHGGGQTQGRLVKIDEDGVTFRSYIDGSTHRFTPEIAIEIEHKLGADIIMAFDECTPDSAPEWYVREAMERTHAWARRCLNYHKDVRNAKTAKVRTANESSFALSQFSHFAHNQFLFGIIQGAGYKHLRQESAKFISSLGFDGIAIGGESIGYNMKATADILDWVYPLMPKNKPHYAMGVGLSPADLLIAVEHGVDMFDCVAPTRLARHGMLLVHDKTNKHRLNIKNARFKNDSAPIEPACACSTCRGYTRSYLHHLFDAGEITGLRLATIHNLSVMLNLMKETRVAITEDRFMELKKQWL